MKTERDMYRVAAQLFDSPEDVKSLDDDEYVRGMAELIADLTGTDKYDVVENIRAQVGKPVDVEEYATVIDHLRIHDEGDGWVIDGADGDGLYTAELLKYDTFEKAAENLPRLKQLLEDSGIRFRNDPAKYTWSGWEVETEETEDGREGVHYLTIHDPQGEEYATIIHRVTDAYSLDSWVAQDKVKKAQAIVDALNATL